MYTSTLWAVPVGAGADTCAQAGHFGQCCASVKERVQFFQYLFSWISEIFLIHGYALKGWGEMQRASRAAMGMRTQGEGHLF